MVNEDFDMVDSYFLKHKGEEYKITKTTATHFYTKKVSKPSVTRIFDIEDTEIWVYTKQLAEEKSEFEQRIDTVLQNLKQTLLKKNKDYGDSYARSVDKYGETVMLVRLGDKFSRLENLILSDAPIMVAEEKIEDTLSDLAGYVVLELERRMRNQ